MNQAQRQFFCDYPSSKKNLEEVREEIIQHKLQESANKEKRETNIGDSDFGEKKIHEQKIVEKSEEESPNTSDEESVSLKRKTMNVSVLKADLGSSSTITPSKSTETSSKTTTEDVLKINKKI